MCAPKRLALPTLDDRGDDRLVKARATYVVQHLDLYQVTAKVSAVCMLRSRLRLGYALQACTRTSGLAVANAPQLSIRYLVDGRAVCRGSVYRGRGCTSPR